MEILDLRLRSITYVYTLSVASDALLQVCTVGMPDNPPIEFHPYR